MDHEEMRKKNGAFAVKGLALLTLSGLLLLSGCSSDGKDPEST